MGRPEVLPPHTSQAKQGKPSLKLPGVRLGGGLGGPGTRRGAAEWQGPSPLISSERAVQESGNVWSLVFSSAVRPILAVWPWIRHLTSLSLSLPPPFHLSLYQVLCLHSGSLCPCLLSLESYSPGQPPVPPPSVPPPGCPPALPPLCGCYRPNSVRFRPKDRSSRLPRRPHFLPALAQALSSFFWICAAAS